MMLRNWIAVASADHVRIGRTGGFMQVCHGKAGPLRRIHPGDRVVYYSPCQSMGGKDRLQSFTALGTVKTGEPYQYDMGNGFCPFRRDVSWRVEARESAIRPLLDVLEFTTGRHNWGYAFRFGLFQISDRDMRCIATHMGIDLTAISCLR